MEGCFPEECLKLIRGLSYFFYSQRLIREAKETVSKVEQKNLRNDGIGWIGCGWYYLENLAIEAGCPISPNAFARDE